MRITVYDLTDLNPTERTLLAADITSLGLEEMDMGDDTNCSTWGDVEREHSRRIGGQKNLKDYCRSLVAGYNRANRASTV